MGMRLIITLFPVIVTAVCALLWVDSLFAVRRLLLIPFGDAELGLKSKAGWLSWNTFWLWDEANPEAAGISLPVLCPHLGGLGPGMARRRPAA